MSHQSPSSESPQNPQGKLRLPEFPLPQAEVYHGTRKVTGVSTTDHLDKHDQKHSKKKGFKTKHHTFRFSYKSFFSLIFGIVIFCMAGMGGYFVGKFSAQKPPVPVSYFEASSEASSEMDKAFEAKRKGNLATALASFQKVKQLQPSLPGIDYLVAEAAFKTHNFQLAHEYAERGLAKKSSPELCQMLLGLMAWQASKDISITSGDRSAKILMERAVAMNPASCYPLYFLGEIEREQGSFDKGGELLARAAARLDPMDSVTVLRTKSNLSKLQAVRDAIHEGDIPAQSVDMHSSDGYEKILQMLVYLYQGKTSQALDAAHQARKALPPEFYMLFIHDSAFREFQMDPALAEVFNKPPAERK